MWATFYLRIQTAREQTLSHIKVHMACLVSRLAFVLYAMSFNQAGVAAGEGIAGLTERIMMLEVSAWYVAMGWKAFRRLG